jgi:hypothetical protein
MWPARDLKRASRSEYSANRDIGVCRPDIPRELDGYS